MTPREALSRAEAELNSISVPVPMIHGIGMPISNALGLIRATIECLARAEEQAKQEQAAQEQAKQEEGKEVCADGEG